MIRYFTVLLLALCVTNVHAQSLTETVKKHIMEMTVVSAKEVTNEIAANPLKLNNNLSKIKEKGGHPFILIRGKIREFTELDTGCIIEIRGDFFEYLSLYSAIDEDVYTYSTKEEVYAFISPYKLSETNSICDIAILSKTKSGLAEKIVAIVNGIMDYPNKRGLLKHLLDVKSSSYEHIGMDNSINAFINYFGLYKK